MKVNFPLSSQANSLVSVLKRRLTSMWFIGMAVLWASVGVVRNHSNLILTDDGFSDTTSSIWADEIVRSPQCPIAIQRARGIYEQRNARSESFKDVVLLTAANLNYLDMLQNWEFLARRQGLKWAVAAMDAEMYEYLGPDRSLLIPEEGKSSSSSTEVLYYTLEFGLLSCNKLRIALHIAAVCDVDIVFSDTDNVFLHDPFSHHLGELIRSGRYDYIYSCESGVTEYPGEYVPLAEGHFFGPEQNTGFYYLNRRSEVVRNITLETLKQCQELSNETFRDDQAIFWSVLNSRSVISGSKWSHCKADFNGFPVLEQKTVFEEAAFCSLDPYWYPCGAPTNFVNNAMITYHANWVVGKRDKIERLKMVTRGVGFDELRIASSRNVSL